MFNFLSEWLAGNNLIPHGYCLAWSPGLVWSMVIADAVIGLSYFSIPVGLLYFVRKHPELRFNWLLVMFGLFILACGTTHFIDIVSIWKPVYRLDALVKIITAAVSLMTAIALYPLLPKISAFIRDRQRAFREVEASNRELEQFAYAVSHDLKSPLRSIGSFAGLLEKRYKTKLGEDGVEYLDFIKQSVGQMNVLIDDLLRLAQVNTSQLEVRCAPASEALRNATELLRYDIATSGARVESAELPQVYADQRLLASMFQNLVSNAIKFQKPGVKPLVLISAERDGEQWKFQVRDNGIGISAENRDKLFQIFKRLHTAEKYPGTGIGLVMCKKIAALHRGSIWLDSVAGEGTTVYFKLPVLPQVGPAASVNPEPLAA